MLTCPVCDSPNADGSLVCEQCNSAFESSDSHRTVQSNDQTVAAVPFSGTVPGTAAGSAYSSELLPGTVLAGRYQIVIRLGQGGMGTVYKALDLELDRIIALKTIRPDLASNTAALRRLKQETLLARQITHRNVIRVFDLGVADGLRFITMEYIEGQDLKAFIEKRGKLAVTETLGIFTEICHGLLAAHAEDVIHRDLKPQNVLIGDNGRVRIMDFGLARSFEDTGLSRTGTVLGTPAYMSPEQALGHPGDARSDIFSCGVMFYELLTGELPFKGRTLAEIFISRTRDKATPIEQIDPALPPWLRRVVMRCLESKPAARYATVREIIDDLAAAERPGSGVYSSGALVAGAMLGPRYRIEAEAGEGGMGKVYRATDLDLNRTVALKVVKPELASDSRALELLKHEISIASQVSHRNILRIHDLGEANGIRFVSMAWADGEDLASLLRRCGPLSDARILELGVQLCEGLQAAHELGITHRDLKPSNILLDAAEHPCIADFGLAHSVALAGSLSGITGETSGTPRYMSPEQVEGGAVDCRTDIYALGLIFYELATGRIPFKDDSVMQTMAQRVTEIPANPKLLNPAVSDALATIILRCLERDPAKRYAQVPDLLRDLKIAQSPAAPLIFDPVTPESSRIGRIILWSSLVLLLALSVGGYLLYRRSEPIEPPSNGRYIAVLPFRALSSDPAIKFAAEGVADTISARLASLSSVHAVSSSALERVSLNQSEKEIGQQLGANLLIRGSVQGEGDRLSVTLSIYNIEKHTVAWLPPFNGNAADLFTLEAEISNEIIKKLAITETLQDQERAAVRKPTEKLATYDLYLKGRDILKNYRDAAHASEALSLFEEASRQDPNFALAWTGMADASLQLYRTKRDSLFASKALAAAEEGRNRGENHPEVHFSLGSVYTATGRNAEAIQELKRALTLQPNSDDGYIRLGRAYLATGQKDLAISAFTQAVTLNPYYWYNRKQLGVAYDRLGRTEDALKEFKEQVRQNPKDASGYNNIGAIYYKRALWSKCIPEFETAIKLQPQADTYSNLAAAYVELGRYAEAIPTYEKAIELNPNKPDVLRNLADAYMHTGQKEKALSTYDRAIALLYNELQVNPRDAGALGMLARCYADKGDHSQALSLIRQARAIDSADSDLMYAEALVNAAAGQLPEALTALRRALESGASFEYCLTDPDLEAVRHLKGFEALKQKFGHAAAARRR